MLHSFSMVQGYNYILQVNMKKSPYSFCCCSSTRW